ncbi:MAG: hypothetical protein JWO82_2407 [Akkermansiaceae bacterium]|nr:hypothetical protein [Akkermansiaceae bacterium]
MNPPALKRLPRKVRSAGLSPGQEYTLTLLGYVAGSDGACPADDWWEFVLRNTHGSRQLIELDLVSLNCRGYVAFSSKGVALMSRLSAALKQEADRNRLRARRGSTSAPDWSLRQRVYDLFPQLRAPLKRSESYTKPAAFAGLLALYPHSHRDEVPANVQLITDAFYATELEGVLTVIAEVLSAGRKVHLLYTRKAIYVAKIVCPKR